MDKMDKFSKQVVDALTPGYQKLRTALDKQVEPPPSIQRLEMHLANKINEARAGINLPRLSFDRQLAAVARAHSAEMMGLNYFAHESPTPGLQNIEDRYALGFGNRPPFLAENIFRSSSSGSRRLSLDLAEDAHTNLMASPGHRANILNYRPTHMGIGITANENGDLWVTQMFSKP